jgi:transposase
MKQEPEFEPTHPQCCFVWKHLTKEGQKERLAEALRREKIILKIQGRKKGESERAAIKRLGENRSNARRWQKRYKAYGLDGLIDWRAPPNGAIPEEICWEVCALRRVDSAIGVDKIISHIATHHQVSVSETTVKRVLRNAGLSRRRGPANVQSVGEQRIELGGMKLIEAAAEETGYLKAMTQGIKGIVDAALEMEGGEKEGDTSDRDAFGRFLPTYNKRFFKGSGEEIGPGFACVEKKRETLSPKQLHLSKASSEIIERKVSWCFTNAMGDTCATMARTDAHVGFRKKCGCVLR